MPHIAMPTPQRPNTHRRSAAAPSPSLSDDEITPCSSPAPEPQEPISSSSSSSAPEPQHRASPRFTPVSSRRGSSSTPPPWSSSSSPSSHKTSGTTATNTSTTSSWHFDPADGEDMDDSQLWQRMLDIQRALRCYNSARMSAALLELEMGVDVRRLAPSRSCLDLMNESVCDLSDEDKQRLVEWLHENPSKRKRSGIWRRSINF